MSEPHDCPKCRAMMTDTGETVRFQGTDGPIVHRVYRCPGCGAGWHFRDKDQERIQK